MTLYATIKPKLIDHDGFEYCFKTHIVDKPDPWSFRLSDHNVPTKIVDNLKPELIGEIVYDTDANEILYAKDYWPLDKAQQLKKFGIAGRLELLTLRWLVNEKGEDVLVKVDGMEDREKQLEHYDLRPGEHLTLSQLADIFEQGLHVPNQFYTISVSEKADLIIFRASPTISPRVMSFPLSEHLSEEVRIAIPYSEGISSYEIGTCITGTHFNPLVNGTGLLARKGIANRTEWVMIQHMFERFGESRFEVAESLTDLRIAQFDKRGWPITKIYSLSEYAHLMKDQVNKGRREHGLEEIESPIIGFPGVER